MVYLNHRGVSKPYHTYKRLKNLNTVLFTIALFSKNPGREAWDFLFILKQLNIMAKIKSTSEFVTKDYITFGISFLALVISVTSIYVNNFRVEESLTIRIVGIGTMGNTPPVDTGYIDLAFINSGNRDCMITNIVYNFVDSETDKINSQWRDIDNVERLPLVLSPRHMATIKVKIPMDLLYMVYLSRNKMQETNRPVLNYVSFAYGTIDSKGIAHDSFTAREIVIKNTGFILDTIYSTSPDSKLKHQFPITKSF